MKLWLQVEEPEVCCSQTLTVASDGRDFSEAKRLLYLLLDNIEHRFPGIPTLWVAGEQERRAFHFHVILLFYTSLSQSKKLDLNNAIWTAWHRLQEGRVVRSGNRFRTHASRFEPRVGLIGYYTKEIERLPRYWWGYRNRTLINQHSRNVTAKEIGMVIRQNSHLSEFLNPRGKSEASETRRLFTMRDVKKMREWCEATLKDFEVFKQRATGRAGKVSDRDYLAFLNRDIDVAD